LACGTLLANITHIVEVLNCTACNAFAVVPVWKSRRAYTSVGSLIKYLVALARLANVSN
jgi:hypothetical protein